MGSYHHIPNLQYDPPQHPWRQRPAEYIGPDGMMWPGGWIQNSKIRSVKKPHYHWIWPKDGKNGSRWGRLKDIVSGKGPDIHITTSADRMDYMHNRQTKPVWTNWTSLDDRGPDGRLKRKSNPRRKYDFRTRKYVKPYDKMWTDAIWQGPNAKSMWPDYLRTRDGTWFMTPLGILGVDLDVMQLSLIEGIPRGKPPTLRLPSAHQQPPYSSWQPCPLCLHQTYSHT